MLLLHSVFNERLCSSGLNSLRPAGLPVIDHPVCAGHNTLEK